MSQYAGIDILEIEGNGTSPREDSFSRGIRLVGPPTGKTLVDDQHGVSGALREFEWMGQGAADVAAFKAWLDARKGRAKPFWLDSCQEDLTVPVGVTQLSGTDVLNIVAVGYADNLFPGTGARRHVCITNRKTFVKIRRKVTSASNNLNGTEDLKLDSALSSTVAGPANWMVGFMRLCRMEDDVVSIEFTGRGYASAKFRAREIPKEAPL